ncbi:MAG: hypothetical protein M3303_05685 [Gemmatimonadota bacterium]|nr:hypothetical protein [Gemmatimonadota bacterium]
MALLSGLTLLHLTMVGADLDCTEHGLENTHSSSQAAVIAQTHQHHAPAQARGTDHHDGSPEMPALPVCCQALTSCGVSLVEPAGTSTAAVPHLAVGVLAAADDVPASWSAELDPPPPKA